MLILCVDVMEAERTCTVLKFIVDCYLDKANMEFVEWRFYEDFDKDKASTCSTASQLTYIPKLLTPEENGKKLHIYTYACLQRKIIVVIRICWYFLVSFFGTNHIRTLPVEFIMPPSLPVPWADKEQCKRSIMEKKGNENLKSCIFRVSKDISIQKGHYVDLWLNSTCQCAHAQYQQQSGRNGPTYL